MASPCAPRPCPSLRDSGRPQARHPGEQGILGTRDPWKLCLVAPEAPSLFLPHSPTFGDGRTGPEDQMVTSQGQPARLGAGPLRGLGVHREWKPDLEPWDLLPGENPGLASWGCFKGSGQEWGGLGSWGRGDGGCLWGCSWVL